MNEWMQYGWMAELSICDPEYLVEEYVALDFCLILAGLLLLHEMPGGFIKTLGFFKDSQWVAIEQ